MNITVLEKLIEKNPKEAERLIIKWESFIASHPEAEYLPDEALKEKGFTDDLIDGKTLTKMYPEKTLVRHEKRQEQEIQQFSSFLPKGIFDIPLLAATYFIDPEVMQLDRRYQGIVRQKKKQWKKDNPGKDFNSQEGLDFLYGSMDGTIPSRLHQETEEEFRRLHPKKAEKYDKKKENLYKDANFDPSVKYHETIIDEHVQARYALLKKKDSKTKLEDVRKQIEEHSWERFVNDHPEKAKEYAEEHEGIKKAYTKVAIGKTLDEYQKTTGKEIKYVEKSHKPEDIRVEEATKEIESIKQPSPLHLQSPIEPVLPGITIISPQGKPLFNTPSDINSPSGLVNTQGRPISSNSTPPLQQSSVGPSQAVHKSNVSIPLTRKSARGLLSKGVDKTNKIASSIGRGALKRFALMNPWILGGILGTILFLVFIIVLFDVAQNGSIFQPGPKTIDAEVDISQCKFYRQGDGPNTEYSFGNPLMAAIIVSIAKNTNIGVPPSLIAAIMRVETPSAVSGTDPTYLKNDFDKHTSGVAYGVMQFTPGTFSDVFKNNKVDLDTYFRIKNVDAAYDIEQEQYTSRAPGTADNTLEIYSITDSIIAAYFKVKNDKVSINGSGPWDEDTIRKIIALYYAGDANKSTNYGNNNEYNYGDDVWKSVSECQKLQKNKSSSNKFIGVTIPNLATKEPERIDHILSYLSNSCGINTVRMLLPFDKFDNQNKQKVLEVLEMGTKYHIKFIIPFADYSNIPNNLINVNPNQDPSSWYKDGYNKQYRKHAENILSFLKENPSIYAWELANGPHCNTKESCINEYGNWTRAMANTIKQIDATHLISIGNAANNNNNLGDNPEKNGAINEQYEKNNSFQHITALSGHYYSNLFSQQKPFMLKDIEIAKKLNKPFYVGEAGFLCGTQDCKSATTENEETRARLVKQELNDLFNAGATGFILRQYADRKDDPIEADEFSFFEGDPICSITKEVARTLLPETTVSGWPTNGSIQQGPQGGTSHNDIYKSSRAESVDLANASSPPVYATLEGIVKTVRFCGTIDDCKKDKVGDGNGNYVDLTNEKGTFTIKYAHLNSIKVKEGDRVNQSTEIGVMGTTGRSDGIHLHYEFLGIPLAPPNIPEAIVPANCDPDKPFYINCSPVSVSRTVSAQPQPTEKKYWFVLHRKSKTEELFQGIPGDKTSSTVIKTYKVNPGVDGKYPTPLHSLLNEPYWIITAKSTSGNESLYGPYFLALNVPYKTPYNGPRPYIECGTNNNEQCDWKTEGQFGLHGTGDTPGRLTDEGSGGCVRHSNEDIVDVYNKIGSIEEPIRYYIENN